MKACVVCGEKATGLWQGEPLCDTCELEQVTDAVYGELMDRKYIMTITGTEPGLPESKIVTVREIIRLFPEISPKLFENFSIMDLTIGVINRQFKFALT